MNYMKILSRAWHILWNYKTLWIFGIILALTSASGGGSGGRGNVNYSGNGGGSSSSLPLPFNLDDEFDHFAEGFKGFFFDNGWQQHEQAVIGIIIALVCLLIVISILFTIAHYVSQVSLIRMVDHYEETDEKMSWKKGLRMGWSRSAWRLFLINLVITIPVVVGLLILFGCAALPVLFSVIAGNDPSIPGIVATIGLAFLAVFVMIVVVVLLSFVLEPIYRVCVLQDLGVFPAIREGFTLIRKNLLDVFLMWLILVGIQIGFFIVMIPIVLFLIILGLITGGAVGVGIYFIIYALASTEAGWVAAAIVGGLIFILILSIPSLFANGLLETYRSSVWTLAYRELKIKMAGLLQPAPSPDSDLEPEPAP